jgi:hypothetical protein
VIVRLRPTKVPENSRSAANRSRERLAVGVHELSKLVAIESFFAVKMSTDVGHQSRSLDRFDDVGGFGNGPAVCPKIFAGSRKRVLAVRPTPYLVRSWVVLAVILPPADEADVVTAPGLERRVTATWTVIEDAWLRWLVDALVDRRPVLLKPGRASSKFIFCYAATFSTSSNMGQLAKQPFDPDGHCSP